MTYTVAVIGKQYYPLNRLNLSKNSQIFGETFGCSELCGECSGVLNEPLLGNVRRGTGSGFVTKLYNLSDFTRISSLPLEGDIAHIKISVSSDNKQSIAIANLIGSHHDNKVDISVESSTKVNGANAYINARVACNIDKLTECINKGIKIVSEKFDISLDLKEKRCIYPGRPVPKYRINVDGLNVTSHV